MAISSVAGAATSAASLLSSAGMTAKGASLLEKARDALVNNPDKYSMSEKLQINWDLGDAFQWNGWFNETEKKAVQKILDDSLASGPGGFVQQLSKFTTELANEGQKLGPFAENGKLLAFYRSYKEPWQQMFLRDQITSLEIDASMTSILKARDGQNGFNLLRDGSLNNIGNIKDPIARQALQLYRDNRDLVNNLGSWRDRQSALEGLLSSLKRLGSNPADIVSLSTKAQDYLDAR